MVLNIDEASINSGNVLLDSGTTDTYLDPKVGAALNDVWQRLMGEKFPTQSVAVSPRDLKKWPTLIFQMKASSEKNTATASPYGAIAGILDSEHPNDVLVAFPPSRYMVLDLSTNVYRPRLVMDGKIKER